MGKVSISLIAVTIVVDGVVVLNADFRRDSSARSEKRLSPESPADGGSKWL